MAESNLKETQPQKYYLKLVSRVLFYLGLGTYWYEDERPQYPRLYILWSIIFNSYIVGVVLDEIFAYKLPDLTVTEMNEVIQFGYGGALVMTKIFVMFLHRHRIQKVSKTLIEDIRDIFTSLELEKQSITKAKRLFYPVIILTYSYLFVTVARWIYIAFRYGKTVKTQATYFPTDNDTGYLYSLLRIFIICHWWLFITSMIAIDLLCYLCLVFTGTKFQLVQLYFETLRSKFQDDRKLDEFKEAVVSGIKLHQNALWCARNVQYAMGNIYTVQICETIVLMAICLIKQISMERTIENLVTTVLYLGCFLLLTACYMITSGDITHELTTGDFTLLRAARSLGVVLNKTAWAQAAAVATSMFHCGWERARTDPGLRKLLVVAMHQAQQPVSMTAFGVLELSYESFIRVLRAAYSFFAIMYSRN